MNGQKIIDRGEIIDQRTFDILRSPKKEWDKRGETITENVWLYSGQILFVSILIGCFMTYLALFRWDYYQKKGSLGLLFFLIIFFPVISAIMVAHAFHECIYSAILHASHDHTDLPLIRTALQYILSILLCSICLVNPTWVYLIADNNRYVPASQPSRTVSTLTIVTVVPWLS